MLEPSSSKMLTFGLLSTLVTLRVPSRTPMMMSRPRRKYPRGTACGNPSLSMVLNTAQHGRLSRYASICSSLNFRGMSRDYKIEIGGPHGRSATSGWSVNPVQHCLARGVEQRGFSKQAPAPYRASRFQFKTRRYVVSSIAHVVVGMESLTAGPIRRRPLCGACGSRIRCPERERALAVRGAGSPRWPSEVDSDPIAIVRILRHHPPTRPPAVTR